MVPLRPPQPQRFFRVLPQSPQSLDLSGLVTLAERVVGYKARVIDWKRLLSA